MARPKAVKASDLPVSEFLETKTDYNLVTFKVLHPVLGYKVGDTFKATLNEVRFQLKHKSVAVA